MLVDVHIMCACTFSMVLQEEGNRYLVDSSDSKTQYIVDVLSSTCPDQPNCLPHCVEKECSYLCRHMISCTCYDFQHGHLCKHTHKVFHLHMQQQSVSDDGESDDGESDDGSNTDAVTDTTDLPSPMEIGVTPPKTAQDEAGMVEG